MGGPKDSGAAGCPSPPSTDDREAPHSVTPAWGDLYPTPSPTNEISSFRTDSARMMPSGEGQSKLTQFLFVSRRPDAEPLTLDRKSPVILCRAEIARPLMPIRS